MGESGWIGVCSAFDTHGVTVDAIPVLLSTKRTNSIIILWYYSLQRLEEQRAGRERRGRERCWV